VDQLRSFRTSSGNIDRVHHQVIDRLIDENYAEIPINFSVTVGSDSRRYKGHQIDSLLSLKAYSWRLNSKVRNLGVDLEEGYEFFMNPDKFKCRGANDPNVYLDDSAERLARNLCNGFMVLADSLCKAGDFNRAETLLLRAREIIPRANEPLQILGRIYSDRKDTEKLQSLLDTIRTEVGDLLFFHLGMAYKKKGDLQQAESSLNSALMINPGYRPAFEELMRLFIEQGKIGSLRSGLMKWLQFNPQDQKIRDLFMEMERSANNRVTVDSSK
jgi:tetratricopeptide (TPR) repeat protein